MRTTIAMIAIILLSSVFFVSGTAFGLTTDEMIQLKKTGVPENTILFMVENNYKDVDRVIKLKEAGFKDETILSTIKNDLKGKPATGTSQEQTGKDTSGGRTEIESASRIKILWYIVHRGDPVLQNSQTIDDARIAVLSGNRIKFEWDDKGGLGLLDAFYKKPFKSPFFWEINESDSLGHGKEGYSYMIQSTVNHKGKPDTDGSHYWILYLDPKDTKIVDYMKERFSGQ
ncbi:MAG: hypothetical protein ACE5IQ_12000 [Candidatus Methylomirabilales bacterium]